MNTMPFQPGDNDPLGGMVDASVIDAFEASQGSQSIGNRMTVELKELLDSAGYDPTNLANTVKNKAQYALNFACLHEYVRLAWISSPLGQKDDETRTARERKLTDIKTELNQEILSLNFQWPRFFMSKGPFSETYSNQHC